MFAAWPKGGEIDILEGVNDHGPNSSVLHTAENCTMVSDDMDGTGLVFPLCSDRVASSSSRSLVSNLTGAGQCKSSAGAGAGCVVNPSGDNSYGPALNAVGGGWYAMERTATSINMWFWARNDTTVPDEVKAAGNSTKTIDPSKWGKPYANFVSNNCDIQNQFQPQNIIINLTLCASDPFVSQSQASSLTFVTFVM